MPASKMQISQDPISRHCEEDEIYRELLPLAGATVVELGCGAAVHTRAIAEGHGVAKIHAFEVDKIQHEKNLDIDDLPNVTFSYGGAEAISLADNSADIVMMFKSLHHVPAQMMDHAFDEIRRVLKPGGLAYISEPIYAGNFNEILRLFNDEKKVREAAFAATQRAVEQGKLELASQTFFFLSPLTFADFTQFEQQILGVTHSNFDISPEIYDKVKTEFEKHVTADGAFFEMPMRVDLLRKTS